MSEYTAEDVRQIVATNTRQAKTILELEEALRQAWGATQDAHDQLLRVWNNEKGKP